MRQKTTNKTQDAKRGTLYKELLTEGVIPLRKNGQRDWASMSDDQLIRQTQEFMKEKEITGKQQLKKDDLGLHCALRRRKLLEKASFEPKR
jgi:hypothetical protein